MPAANPQQESLPVYKTDHLLLVVFLIYSHRKPTTTEWDGEYCQWAFAEDEALLTLVADFEDGAGRVEPKRYTRILNATKREIHKRRFGH